MLEALVAKRPIAKGQQLVWDYQLAYWKAPHRQNQLCFFEENTGKVSSVQLKTPVAPASAVNALSSLSSSEYSTAHRTVLTSPTVNQKLVPTVL